MLDLKDKRLFLASKSPRRAHLLKLIGLEFDIIDSHVQEGNETYTIPEVHALELAEKKARNAAESVKEGIIIGADTVVALDSRILGKPRDKDDAKRMLNLLSGRVHTVVTGFCIIDKPSTKTMSDYDRTLVEFRQLNDHEIDAYVQTGHPMDKAGAYGIQDQSALFVQKINGCFYNVVGFPLTKFYLTFRMLFDG